MQGRTILLVACIFVALPPRCCNSMKWEEFVKRYREGGGQPTPSTLSPVMLRPHATMLRKPDVHDIITAEGSFSPGTSERGCEQDGLGQGGDAGELPDGRWDQGEEGLWNEGQEDWEGEEEGWEEVGWLQVNPTVTRSFVPAANLPRVVDGCARMRLVSYNVLGASQAMSPIHNYCPIEYRMWNGAGGRCEGVTTELRGYDSDVVCLQEVTPRMFETDLLPRLPGYEGVHVTMKRRMGDMGEGETVEGGAAMGGFGADDIGICTLVKLETFEIVAFQSVFFRDMVRARPSFPDSPLKDKLKQLSNGMVIILLRHRAHGRRIVVGNLQLFWKPEMPHLKAVQAQLACAAVTAFRLKHVDKLAGVDQVPIVLTGDWNSVRELQYEYLPPFQREALVVERESEGFVPRGSERSGVFELLMEGVLDQGHPQHPDSFAKAKAAKPWGQMTPEEKKIMRFNKKQQRGLPRLGQLTTGLALKDCCEEGLGMPVPITTKTPSFAGAIDYIWRDPGVAVEKVLEMPYSDPEEFAPIPDSWYPSDHLCIGADFVWDEDVIRA